MQFREYEIGNLEFVDIDAEINRRSRTNPTFLFNEEYYSSEYLAVEYFKTKGYDAFFSENTTWKNMLRILFKDIFKKFEGLGKEKNYKRNFYDNEFFRIYEDEINERFDYLKNVDLADEIEQHSFHEWIKYRILRMCEHLKKDQILSVLHHMIQDYAHNHIGFPDIFVFNENNCFFCEVKANSDDLRPVQVRRHEVLLKTGIDVCVFGINKKSSWIAEEKAKYFNEDYIDEENFIEIYDYKIRTANKTYEKLANNKIDDIKKDFLDRYDLDTFIGFLNVISKKNHIEINDSIINQSKREADRIRNLKYLSNGFYFEERGLYSNAIDEYQHVDTYEKYERLAECYRRDKDGESQVNLIYHVLNDADDIPYEVKRDFKQKANRLFRNKRSITTYDTDMVCPICGSAVKLTKLAKRNNISIFTCTKSGCYWYGGVYKGNLKKFSKANRLQTTDIDSHYLDIDVNDLSYSEKISLKRKLAKQGNGYMDRVENANAIAFYNRLLTHDLFINDYHPYRKLARLYHKERLFKKEVEIIVSFFNSGIYCDDIQLKWFLKRLNQLAKYGNISYSKINELEREFSDNGAKNIALSNEPVPQAINLKRQRTKF